jgi:hypothetical protein
MSRITPTTEVNIWNFAGKAVPVKLLILMTWKTALKAELKGLQLSAQPVFPIVREFLGVPDSYTDADVSQHITDSYDSVKAQLTVATQEQ